MRRETTLKILLILLMVVMIFTIPTKVFAISDDTTDLNDLWDDWEDQGSKDDLEGDEDPVVTPTPTPTPQATPTPQITTEANKYNTNIPKAGLVEDTMLIVVITILAITAIYAFKKLSDYQNI